MIKVLAFLILFLSLVTTSAGQINQSSGQVAIVPGTRVSLTPPDGFTASTQFPGYSQESKGASIIVTEFPAPFSELLAGFAISSELEKKRLSLLDRQEIKLNEHKAALLKMKQEALGTEYLKWLLVFGDEKESVLISATFPKELETELSEKMKASVLTAQWNKEKKVSATEGLNFTFEEKGEMKLGRRIANTLLYTKSGIFPSKAADDPLFVIGQALAKIELDDKEEFARIRLSQIVTIKEIEIEKTSQVVIDNLNGYEIIAKGKDAESGQPMVVYQTMLFEDQGYYIMQGLISERFKQSYLPVFKEMTASFRRRK